MAARRSRSVRGVGSAAITGGRSGMAYEGELLTGADADAESLINMVPLPVKSHCIENMSGNAVRKRIRNLSVKTFGFPCKA